MYVKPIDPSVLVRDPVRGDVIPVEGREVEENSYWLRRIRFKEVMRATPPHQKKKGDQ